VSLPPASPSTANACRIDPNYLSDPADMEGTIRAVRDAAKWFETAAFKSVADQPLLPKENRWDNESLARLIRAYSTTLFHPVGTCRMGTDPLSVVDPRLQVHGLQGVFVADASVMPAIPRGNTQAATWMIAERLSEWLVAS
jgi:choline dehydrogenase